MVWSISKNKFSLQISLLRLVGVSINETDSVGYQLYSFIVLGAILFLPVFSIFKVLQIRDNFDDLMENLVFGSTFLATFIKILYLFLIRKKLGKALHFLHSGAFVSNSERVGKAEQKLLKRCMSIINGQTILIDGMAIATLFFGSFATLIVRLFHSDSRYWRLPYGGFSLFDVTHSPNFEIVWAYQSVFVSMACVGYCTTDAFVTGVMVYLRFQCKILQNTIRTSITRTHAKMKDQVVVATSKTEWTFFQQTLKAIVKHHMAIAKSANEFDRIFNVEMLINFVGFSIVICLALFHSISMSSFNFRHLQLLPLAGGAAFNLLMSSYWGNEVMLESLAVGKCCSEVNFVGVDVRFQKALCLIMKRAQKPIRFSVGNFAPLTLNTFLMVMRATYSYYMVLLHMIKDTVTES